MCKNFSLVLVTTKVGEGGEGGRGGGKDVDGKVTYRRKTDLKTL